MDKLDLLPCKTILTALDLVNAFYRSTAHAFINVFACINKSHSCIIFEATLMQAWNLIY